MDRDYNGGMENKQIKVFINGKEQKEKDPIYYWLIYICIDI